LCIFRSTASRIWALCRAARPAVSLPSARPAPGGKLPLNTSGGSLSYMHSGMCGMYALQESMRQMPRHVADPIARRRGTQRNGRCRAQTRRHRRCGDRRRDAGDGRALPGAYAEVGRRHRGRRLLVHDPCPPCRRSHRLGSLRDGADHAWRERPFRRSGVGRTHNVVAPTSLAGQFEQPYGQWGRRRCSRSRYCDT
jgi:hypothetical protein